MLVRIWSNWKSDQLLGGKHGTGTVEDSLAVSYEVKYTPTLCPSNPSPWD